MKINNDIKHSLEVNCSVPQGPLTITPAPLLFLIYVNDFVFASKLKHVMFADDTNVFISDKNIGKLFQRMNKELKSVSSWYKANNPSVNINKTKRTIFQPTFKKCFMPSKFPELFIDDIRLGTAAKFLGVFIDENITLKTHINTISNKISESISILYSARLIPKRQ